MEQQQATVPRPERPAPVEVIDVEQAEAVIVEHYARLARLAYLVLPRSMGRGRRAFTAHAVVQRALPRQRVTAPGAGLPTQRAGSPPDGPGYAFVRLRVLIAALGSGRPRWRIPVVGREVPLPLPTAPLPRIVGLRLFPRSGGAEELAVEQALASLSAPARAAYVLRDLERLTERDAEEVLTAAGVEDPRGALAHAGGGPHVTGSG
ncbi:hypothetical protein ABZX96_35930, partial [Streptomyces sp. NPDC003077]